MLGGLSTTFLRNGGEWLCCNCLGGFPISVALLFGAFGQPAVLVASEPKFLGVVMAGDHLLLLGHSTFPRHVGALDVLLGEAFKNFVSLSGRASASSCILGTILFQPVVTEFRREAALSTSDEDDWGILVWAAMYFLCFSRVSLQNLQCKPYLLHVKCNPGF